MRSLLSTKTRPSWKDRPKNVCVRLSSVRRGQVAQPQGKKKGLSRCVLQYSAHVTSGIRQHMFVSESKRNGLQIQGETLPQKRKVERERDEDT